MKDDDEERSEEVEYKSCDEPNGSQTATAQSTLAESSRSGSDAINSKRKRDGCTIPVSNVGDIPIWVAGSSPTKYVDMKELMSMSNTLENLAIVHEIAINPQFVIEKKYTNPVEKVVEESMRKAYWDKLREDFVQEPPDYSHALGLIVNIKQMMLDLLTPQHVRLNDEIESLLDIDLLKQQAEKHCLDVRNLLESIVELLGRMCAPSRDGLVTNLREEKDNVNMLRGISELLDVMKLDMANFYLHINRSVVEQYSSEYERSQFMKLIQNNPEMELSTLNWLRRHMDTGIFDGPSAKKRFEDLDNREVGNIINDAYMDLLEWDSQYPYPGTLKMDRLRLEALANRYLQLSVCVSCVLISCNLGGKDVAQSKDIKTILKNDVIVVTNDINKSNIASRLEMVSVLCNERISQCRKSLNIGWTEENSTDLKQQILHVCDANNRVYTLIRDRIRSFILLLLSNPVPSNQQRFPSGLSMIHAELSTLTVQFLRIVNHNRQTFGAYYGELIGRAISE